VVYAPEVVARSILHCCEHAHRTIYVGGAGWALVLLANHAPRLYDMLAAGPGYAAQSTDRPADADGERRDNLHEPKPGAVRARQDQSPVRETSLFAELQQQPQFGLLALGAVGLITLALLRGGRQPTLGERVARRVEPVARAAWHDARRQIRRQEPVARDMIDSAVRHIEPVAEQIGQAARRALRYGERAVSGR
jgi:hypothetical protein